MKAFSYLRVSGKSQIEGDGFPRQRVAIDRQAKLMGATIAREFVEEGVTGDSTWENRPAFQDMLSEIFGNGVRTIIVENLTRLSRAYVVQDAILVFLASKGITLISADTGEDITAAIQGDPMKKAIIQMQAVFSELEKNSLVRKLRAARNRKREEIGRCEGQKPYGTLPGEQDTITLMRSLRRKPIGQGKRMSYARIATELNARSIPTRQGGEWGMSSVKTILLRKSN